MNTTLETSLSLPVLVIGALASISFFIFLFRQELAGVSRGTRWCIGGLRILLCLLVWFLIAQPRAVTTHETTIPVTTRLGVDVSGSMSLTDDDGVHTARWQQQAKPSLLEEATALTEAAKIRIGLLKRRFKIDEQDRNEDIGKTRDILMQSLERIRLIESSSNRGRLVKATLDALTKAVEELQRIDDGDAIRTLERAASHATEAATALRRIAEIAPQEDSTVEEPRPRMELVNRWIDQSPELFQRLDETGEVQRFAFANSMVRSESAEAFASDDGLGDGTELYGNLNRLADEGTNTGGRELFVLITDGIDSRPDENQVVSTKVQDRPLLVLPIGDPSTAPDVSIESVISPTRVREEDTFVAQVKVASRNGVSEAVVITLQDGSQMLARRELQLTGDDETKAVELEWNASGLGARDLWVEASIVTGEELVSNNQKQISCQVTKDKYRVLVCDSKPRWETRYLQNLFKRDASIEMVSLLFQPRHAYPGKDLPPQGALPLALELWQKFDLVILGDVSPEQLTPDHQATLIQYVDGGGNLLVLAGFDAMPAAFAGTQLEKLMPMIQAQTESVRGTFVINPSGENADPIVRLVGDDGQSVWHELFTITPQHRISAWCKAKQTARSLLVAEDVQSQARHDFMALQRYGRGRVAFAAAPSLYHLRSTYGDRYHARFWGQMIRGICVDNFGFEGGLVKTRLDRTVWGAGAEVMGRVRLTTPEGLPLPDAEFSAILLELNDDDEEVVAQMRPIADPDRPGDYFVRFPDAKPGKYIIQYEGDEIESLLEVDRFERNEQLADLNDSTRKLTVLGEELSPETTHSSKPSPFWGRVNRLPLAATVSPQTISLVVDALDFKPELVTESSKRSLWNVWWFLLAMIIVAGSEWLLRRTNGLC